jgi:trk system potassium uptake protein TrkA
MKIIIVGCGRVGSRLARTLSLQGHTVTVVDKDPTAFEQLGASFKGKTVTGIGFDQDVLKQAGIQHVDALAAVTSSDETNVVTARLAKRVFHVPRVAARVYDPRKAEIYRRLGLQTISPVALGSVQLAELLSFSHLDTVATLGSGDVHIVDVEIPPLLVGRSINELAVNSEILVVAITRNGKTFLPIRGTSFQDGDLAHLAVISSSSEQLKALLG